MPHPDLPDPTADTAVRTGGCLCGALRFIVAGEPDDPHICGCAHCARRSGSPFQWWTSFPLTGLSWTGEHGEPAWYDTHPGKTRRGSCSICYSHVAALDYGDPEAIGILVTALDDHRNDPALLPLNPNRLNEAAPWLAPAPTRHQEPVDVHLLLRRDGADGPDVLLSRRAGAVYATGLHHLPSGHIDGPHEDAVRALIREGYEETGIVIDPDDVRHSVTVHHRAPGGAARIGLVFEVRCWSGEPRIMEPAVCDAMGWYPLSSLPSPMVAYCRAALDAYQAGLPFAVHFQEPGDPVSYAPEVGRLHPLLPAGAGAGAPEQRVREFTEQAVGRIGAWTDTSWPREGSRVWRASGTDGGQWFVKLHQGDKFHDREVTAYRTWVPALGAAAPRLVATDPALRAVILTAVPGRSLHGAVHPPEEQRLIFHRIGQLAAAIHQSAPARPGGGAPAALGKLERHLAGARELLAPGDEDYIRAVAKSAEQLPPFDAVPTHGDFQLRNLRWDTDSGSLYVIDFERAEWGPAIRDFVRLSDAWTGRPDLHEAVMAGYGRPLTAAEEQHLAVHAVLDAVSGIQYGTTHDDPELVERGLRTLARLRAAHRP
ncbi:phosphotransferase [Kitasatospora sp. NPDC004240]